MQGRLSASSQSGQHEVGPRLLVRTIGGTPCEMSPSTNWRADDLRHEIEKRLCVPAAQQRLFLGEEILLDSDLDALVLRPLLVADDPLELTLLIRSPAAAEMLEAIQQYNSMEWTMYEDLRGDKEIVTAAVRRSGWALAFAADELRGDKDVVTEAVREYGIALQYAADKLRADKGIVIEAVRRDPLALEFAADELRADKDVVTEAVSQHGMALEFAAEELRADDDIVAEARSRRGRAVGFAAAELPRNRNFLWNV